MKEIIEQIVPPILGAWRYRWVGLAASTLTCVLGWIVVILQPDVYEAKTRVYVDTASQLRELLDGQIVESGVDEELRYVREALLGRLQLERLARETGLDTDVETPLDQQVVVSRLAQNIQVFSSSDTETRHRREPDTDATYTIVYRNEDRAMAINVVSVLLDIFVVDTLGAKRTSSEVTGQFVSRQLQEYEVRLQEAEARLAAFKGEHIDRLPSMQGDYFERLQIASEALQTKLQELELAQSRLNTVEQQLRGEAPRLLSTSSADPGSIDARILEAQSRLDDFRLRYTEDHPDVIAGREILKSLQERKNSEISNLQASGSHAADNPVFQALQISKNEIETEIATLNAELSFRQRRVDELRELITEMPEVEAELARLNRDYDVVSAQYQVLLNSLERERLTREVADSEEVQFRVIDPPSADTTPVSPPRALLLIGVLMAAFAVGALSAHVLNLLNPVYQSVMELQRFNLPLLGTVSRSWGDNLRSHQVRAIRRFATGFTLLIAANVGVLLFEISGPGLRSLL